MRSDVEEIKSRLNIVDVVGEYVRLTKAGANWKGLCPFHHEKNPSFMVHEEKQIYHCFGCQKGGDILSFIMEIEGLEFREALKILAERAGVQLSNQAPQQKTDDKKKILEIIELATKFYEVQLWKGVGKENVMGYLRERGLIEDTIRNFRLGFAPQGWRNVLNFLTERGYKVEDIERAGLIIRKNPKSEILNPKQIQNSKFKIQNSFYDRFRNRIMFPICDGMGKVIGYSARVAPGDDESQAKYINTPETSVYHKSEVLYGLHLAKQAIKQKNAVLLVEGNMDVIASHQAGLSNTVAVSGTALTSKQIDILKRYAKNIQMLFDMDSAGNQALNRSADLAFNKDVEVSVVRLGEGKDAADVVQKDASKLVSAVEAAMPAMEYFFQAAVSEYDLRDPQQKKQFVQDLGQHVANMENQIEKMHWIKKIAHEIDSAEETVLEAVSSLKEHNPYRHEETNDVVVEDNSFAERSDLVKEKLIGLMLSDKDAWQWCAEEYITDPYVKEDKFLQTLFKEGAKHGYALEQMLFSLEDEKLRGRFAKLAFDSKYRFESADAMENSSEEIKEQIKQYMAQFVKELQKQKLRSIIRDIKKAEQSGDRNLLGELMSEFTKLSQELT